MHLFQPVPIHYIEKNPFELIGQDWMLITAQKENLVNTMTASWGGLGVIWGKNAAYIFVRNSRYTKEFLDASNTFSLSFFNSNDKIMKQAMKYLGTVSGRDEDKIKEAGIKINLHVDEDKTETPFIDEAQMVLICRKMFAQELSKENFLVPDIAQHYQDEDYHVLYIGEIQNVLIR